MCVCVFVMLNAIAGLNISRKGLFFPTKCIGFSRWRSMRYDNVAEKIDA